MCSNCLLKNVLVFHGMWMPKHQSIHGQHQSITMILFWSLIMTQISCLFPKRCHWMSFTNDCLHFLYSWHKYPLNFKVSLPLRIQWEQLQSKTQEGQSWNDSVQGSFHASIGAVLMMVCFTILCHFAGMLLSTMPFKMNCLCILYQHAVCKIRYIALPACCPHLKMAVWWPQVLIKWHCSVIHY